MNIQKNVELKSYNTMKVSCIADYFCIVQTKDDFIELQNEKIYQSHKKLFLGWWSNLLFTKPIFEWLIIKNEIFSKEIIEETNEYVVIQVWAWENRDQFVHRTLQKWYVWLENLVSIPGTVWAAPMQNIWAYWVEVKESIINVQWIDLPSKTEIILAAYECNFWYRKSIFKHELKDKFFITHVTFKLEKYRPNNYFPMIDYWAIQSKLNKQSEDELNDKPLTPKIVADCIAEIRAWKLPDRTSIGTAWSFFKNPIVSKHKYKELLHLEPSIKGYEIDFEWKSIQMYKLNAGQLIDLAWLKWMQHWNVWTYHKHALILINNGKWTWKEVVELSERIQSIVKETYDIDIEPEVNFVY